MYNLSRLCLLFLLICAVACKQPIDTIVYNATVYTVDSSFSTIEAFAIDKGKIVDRGSSNEICNKYSSAKNKIDVKGKYIYPGFIDAHCHYTWYAFGKNNIDLSKTVAWQDIIDSIQQFAKRNPTGWIIGKGWDQNKWFNKKYPTNKQLNELFPNRPIALGRIDGHALLCNDTVLQLAKINNTTRVEGGQIITENNKPTGVLIDNAMEQVVKLYPANTAPKAISSLQVAQLDCVSLGLTSVVDCGVDKEVVDWVKEAYKQKKLQLRMTVLLSDNTLNIKTYMHQQPYKNDWLHIAGYKVYADGSLGSRGAYLLEEYSDLPSYKGTMLKSTDSITLLANQIIQTPYQMCTHAIGDGANRTILKIYANTLGKQNNRRWRIEHAQVINENDFHYFQQYSIIPSVQPTHATSDMHWVKTRLGNDRVKNAYAYQKLLQQNGWLPLGTDFPIEQINPLLTFYAAVFRMDEKEMPESGFQIENALTPEQAIRGMTIWAAQSVFEEKYKGSIELGKLADFVILNKNLMTITAKEMHEAKVEATYINGEKVF